MKILEKTCKNFIDLYNRKNGKLSKNDRLSFAKDVFKLTHEYDLMIGNYLNQSQETDSGYSVSLPLSSELRYGENPHQEASL